MGAALLFSMLLAHPVAENKHDRTIMVRLAPGAQPHQLLVRVDYRLEVHETTAVFDDMKPFQGEVDFANYRGKLREFYALYAKLYEPILAGNLRVRLNGQKLTLTCVSKTQTLEDEKGDKLGHLRCDFVFMAQAFFQSGKENTFDFREGNYLLQEGKIDVSVAVEGSWRIVALTAPDEELKKRTEQDLKPGDDDRLREASVRLAIPAAPAAVPEAPGQEKAPDSEAARPKADEDHTGLKQLMVDYFFKGNLPFWVVLMLAGAFGAVHALTPGHGKTLVAAYLVGQRGTIWHAIFLGLVTTLTHTGAVLLLALILRLLPDAAQRSLQHQLATGIGLALGLLIVCLGVWLLLQRLSGQADHFHLGGHHHHHHGPGAHHHHGHGAASSGRKVQWWGLVLLGVTGGLIPCWDAIVILVAAIAVGLFWLAFPLILAFSAGLAGTLVLVGILVVKFRAFAESRWGEGRLVRALPIASAVAVTLVGFWLCYDSVQGKQLKPPDEALQAPRVPCHVAQAAGH